jgi:hypothetical protein
MTSCLQETQRRGSDPLADGRVKDGVVHVITNKVVPGMTNYCTIHMVTIQMTSTETWCLRLGRPFEAAHTTLSH